MRTMLLLLIASLAATAEWPGAVPGHRPPQPGEHPRLFFRKADVPGLRARAATPEGRVIVARLKTLLGGGEAMPAALSPARRFDDQGELPLGGYTLWHGAGFGLLYQLTGEARYADLGRRCVELAWEGQRDRDARYALSPPTEPMRAGPSLYAIALAYDLCYDGWPPDFRLDQARRLTTWSQPCQKRGGEASLQRLALSPDNPNRVSNHFALQVGGAGLAILAVRGDPGVDDARLGQWQEGVHRHARKVLSEDFGEAGHFDEGAGPGVIASTWTFVPWLQAERVCGGRDWLGGHPNGEWITLRYVMQLTSDGGSPVYMNTAWSDLRGAGGYGTDHLVVDGGHHGAYFCQGFGAIRPEYRPALLWSWRTFVAPHEPAMHPDQARQGQSTYDVYTYPHRALFALVNWPFDVEPRNPGEVLPKVSQDRRYGQYVHRNRWRDGDDILVSVLYGARSKGDEAWRNRIMVRAFGKRMGFARLTGRSGAETTCIAEADGSGVTAGCGSTVGVDFSGASGTDALVVVAGGAATADLAGDTGDHARATLLDLPAGRIAILSLTRGTHPPAVVEGDVVRIGGQTIRFADGAVRFTQVAPAGAR